MTFSSEATHEQKQGKVELEKINGTSESIVVEDLLKAAATEVKETLATNGNVRQFNLEHRQPSTSSGLISYTILH